MKEPERAGKGQWIRSPSVPVGPQVPTSSDDCAMSALPRAMSALPLKADMLSVGIDVR